MAFGGSGDNRSKLKSSVLEVMMVESRWDCSCCVSTGSPSSRSSNLEFVTGSLVGEVWHCSCVSTGLPSSRSSILEFVTGSLVEEFRHFGPDLGMLIVFRCIYRYAILDFVRLVLINELVVRLILMGSVHFCKYQSAACPCICLFLRMLSESAPSFQASHPCLWLEQIFLKAQIVKERNIPECHQVGWMSQSQSLVLFAHVLDVFQDLPCGRMNQ